MKKLFFGAALIASIGCQTTPRPVVENFQPTHSPESKGPRYPADISQTSQDDYQIEDCYPRYSGEVYKILINGSDANQGGRLDSRGCFKTSFRNGKLRAGDNVVIQVNGNNIDSQTAPGNSGSGNSNRNNNHNNNSGNQAPSIPSADLGKVRDTAENNARCMANAVVASYGRVERFRYNYYMGLRNGISIYNLVNMGSLQNTPDYIAGAKQGAADGAANGLAKGREQGSVDGASQGGADARTRFSAVIDSGNPPERSLNVPPSGFSGLSSDERNRTIEQRLSALDGDINSWLRQQTFAYDGWSYVVVSDYWSASRLYSWNSYQFELVSSWYRDDWAFDLWKQRRFSRCSDQADYYQNLTDPSQTRNAGEAAGTFRNTFKREYDNVIGNKWRQEVMQSEPIAYTFGQQHGIRVAKEYARDAGYFSAFNSSFGTASVRGHSETFSGSYENSFQRTFQRYESNPVVEGFAFDFKTNNSRNSFGAGSPVNLILKRAVNLGLKDGTVMVKVDGNVSNPIEKKVTLKRSESLKEPVSFPDMGFVGFKAAPGAPSRISAVIGGAPIDMDFRIDWNVTAFNLATSPNKGVKAGLLVYMRAHLKSEFLKMTGVFDTNLYSDNKPNNSLLEQLVGIYEHPNSAPAFKAGIRAVARDLKLAIGERPSGLFAGGKDEWDAASALYDRLAR